MTLKTIGYNYRLYLLGIMKLNGALNLITTLLLYLLYSTKVNAYVPYINKIQLITQIEYCYKSQDFEKLSNNKTIAVENIAKLYHKIQHIKNNHQLTQEQKNNHINKSNNKII